jgi:hypothetical protein
MLRDLVLPVALDKIWHDLFRNPIRGLVARRIAEGSSVSAQSCLYLGAVYYRVLICYKKKVL